MDREKIIKGLHDIGGFIAGQIGIEQARNFLRTIDDAIKFLKEQEAVEPAKWIYPTDIVGFGRCPHCNSLWDYSLISNRFFKHCPRCGKTVKRNA